MFFSLRRSGRHSDQSGTAGRLLQSGRDDLSTLRPDQGTGSRFFILPPRPGRHDETTLAPDQGAAGVVPLVPEVQRGEVLAKASR